MKLREKIALQEKMITKLNEENAMLKSKPLEIGDVGDLLIYKMSGGFNMINACGLILDNKNSMISTTNTKTGKKVINKYGYSICNISDFKDGNSVISVGVNYNEMIAIIKKPKDFIFNF